MNDNTIVKIFYSCHAPSAMRWRSNVHVRQPISFVPPGPERLRASAAPAVTANPAPRAQPGTESQIWTAPQFTVAQQTALLASLSPEMIAALVALAQAAGSLPKPAASTPSNAEPSCKAKRKPVGTARAADQAGAASRKSRKLNEERFDKETARSRKAAEGGCYTKVAFDERSRRRGTKGGRRSNFTLEQQATVAKICSSELGFPRRHDWHARLARGWETLEQENPSLSGLPPPGYSQVYKWLKHHHSSDSEPSDARPPSEPALPSHCDGETAGVPPSAIRGMEAPDPVETGGEPKQQQGSSRAGGEAAPKP